MNNSKRKFIKLIVWGVALFPVVAHTRLMPFKDATLRAQEIPQNEVGGGMSGVDFSHYYKSAKSESSSSKKSMTLKEEVSPRENN